MSRLPPYTLECWGRKGSESAGGFLSTRPPGRGSKADKARFPNIVLDTVLKSSSGADLLDAPGTKILVERLIPLSD